MPRMNGRDCFEAIKAISTKIKVIIASGFFKEDMEAMKEGGLSGFISKPYRNAALSKTINEVLKENVFHFIEGKSI